MIVVFKTDVQNSFDVRQIVQKLHEHLPASRISFDLQDCDKVLRIETSGSTVDMLSIQEIVRPFSFSISPLED